MSKFSKILILIFLIFSISVGFTIAHFSKAEGFTSSTEGSVYICPEATSLEEINPLCPGIVVLKLRETIEGLTLSATTYEGQEYYLVIGFKNGGGGEFGIAEKIIKDINDYIQGLPDKAFKNNPQQRKNALKNKLEEVFIKIENREYQEAIQKLQNDIKAKADGAVGGNPKDDWIINPTTQKDICEMIDDFIVHLQGLL